MEPEKPTPTKKNSHWVSGNDNMSVYFVGDNNIDTLSMHINSPLENYIYI